MSSSNDGIHLVPLGNVAGTIPSDKPVTMLNLIHFRRIASYPTSDSSQPISGREAYMTRYIPSFTALAAKLNIKFSIVYLGTAHASLLAGTENGEQDKWDIVALIRYEKFGDFRRLIECEEYQIQALPHRLASIGEYKLVASTEMSL